MSLGTKLDEFKIKYTEIDIFISSLMKKYSLPALRASMGIIFIWFGALKPLGLSSANSLLEKTVYFIPADVFIPILGIWEVIIGIGLIYKPLNRIAIFLLFLQMGGTFLPLVLLPTVTFSVYPLVPTLEGQYIIKNLVLISAALVIGGNVRE